MTAMSMVSITHGSPRQHIWTFASGLFSGPDSRPDESCPCNPGSPPFVGNDFSCDSVATADNYDINPYRLYPDNALWDGIRSLNGC